MAEPLPLPVFHVVGFTGHRQLRDTAGVTRKIEEVLTDLRGRGGADWIALSSVAEGADLVFARTARRLGLGWEALLPLPPADFRSDFTPEAWRDVEQLLMQAEHVRVVSEVASRATRNCAAASRPPARRPATPRPGAPWSASSPASNARCCRRSSSGTRSPA